MLQNKTSQIWGLPLSFGQLFVLLRSHVFFGDNRSPVWKELSKELPEDKLSLEGLWHVIRVL